MAKFEIPMESPNFATELALLGVTGSLSYAPHGTAIPQGMAPYSDPVVNLGWLADDGLTEAMNEESNGFTPWQSDGPIRTSITSREFTFNATLWSIGGLANALYYGVPEEDMAWNEEADATGGGYVEFEQGGTLPPDFRFMLPIDVIDGDKHRRFILPAASVSERSDVTYQKGELTGYPLTFKANFDAVAGCSVIRRFAEGWKPGTAGTLLGGTTKTASLGEWHEPVTGDTSGDGA